MSDLLDLFRSALGSVQSADAHRRVVAEIDAGQLADPQGHRDRMLVAACDEERRAEEALRRLLGHAGGEA